MADPDAPDNVMDDVLAAQRELAGETPEAPPQEPVEQEPPQETAQQAADRARDEAGRFKAKEPETKPRETLTLKDKPQTEQPQAQPGTPEKQPDQPVPPPAEWKGAGKVQWNKLPKAVQAELRETYESVAAQREQYAPLEAAIAPHREVLLRDAGSVENGVNQLMQFYRAYLDNPAGLIQHIARTRGIDLGAPQGQPQPGTPQPTPDINSLIAQTVQQAIAPIQERFAQTENQQLTQTIESFREDPKHPYFEDVRVQMGQLLTAAAKMGQKMTLDDAYDQAIWANPAIRAQLLADQAEEAKRNQTAQVATAQRARAASLRGSPLPNPSGGASQGSSVLDDVRAAAAEMAGT